MNYCIIADDVEFGWPVIQIFVTVNFYIDVDNFSVKGCFTCLCIPSKKVGSKEVWLRQGFTALHNI
jgi:hypothetical protein